MNRTHLQFDCAISVSPSNSTEEELIVRHLGSDLTRQALLDAHHQSVRNKTRQVTDEPIASANYFSSAAVYEMGNASLSYGGGRHGFIGVHGFGRPHAGGMKWGFYRTGAEGGHGYAAALEFGCDSLGKGKNETLGGGIHGVVREGDERQNGRHIHDATLLAGDHVGPKQLGKADEGSGVQCNHLLVVSEVHFDELSVASESGIVNEP